MSFQQTHQCSMRSVLWLKPRTEGILCQDRPAYGPLPMNKVQSLDFRCSWLVRIFAWLHMQCPQTRGKSGATWLPFSWSKSPIDDASTKLGYHLLFKKSRTMDGLARTVSASKRMTPVSAHYEVPEHVSLINSNRWLIVDWPPRCPSTELPYNPLLYFPVLQKPPRQWTYSQSTPERTTATLKLCWLQQGYANESSSWFAILHQ